MYEDEYENSLDRLSEDSDEINRILGVLAVVCSCVFMSGVVATICAAIYYLFR